MAFRSALRPRVRESHANGRRALLRRRASNRLEGRGAGVEVVEGAAMHPGDRQPFQAMPRMRP
jgi:hypothetical protein